MASERYYTIQKTKDCDPLTECKVNGLSRLLTNPTRRSRGINFVSVTKGEARGLCSKLSRDLELEPSVYFSTFTGNR